MMSGISCAHRSNFVPFLSNEIASLGGRSNGLDKARAITGEWTIGRDDMGAAIDTKDISFESLTNLLTSAYGEPILYLAANERRATTFVYPVTNVGIAIFIRSKGSDAQVTLTKPITLPD